MSINMEREKNVDLIELFLILWKHRITFLASILLINIVGFLIISGITPKYESKSSIIPLDNGSNIPNYPGFGLPIKSSDKKVIAILKSRTIRKRVAKELKLFANEEVAINKLKQMVKIDQDPNLSTIYIITRCKNPKLAKMINESYLKNLRQILDEKNLSIYEKNLTYISSQLQQTADKIKKDMEDLVALQKKYGFVLPPFGRSPEALTSFFGAFEQGGTQAADIITNIFTLESKYNVLKSEYYQTEYQALKHHIYIEVLDPPNLPLGPSYPNKHFLYMVVFVSSIFFSIFLAFLKEFLDKFTERLKNQK